MGQFQFRFQFPIFYWIVPLTKDIRTYFIAIIWHCSSGDGNRWSSGRSSSSLAIRLLLLVLLLLSWAAPITVELSSGTSIEWMNVEIGCDCCCWDCMLRDGDTDDTLPCPLMFELLNVELFIMEVLWPTRDIQSGVTVMSPSASVDVHFRSSSTAAGCNKVVNMRKD